MVPERLAVIETRLDETLEAMRGEIRALTEALKDVARVSAVETLQNTVAAQALQIQALRDAHNFGAGAGKVEQRVHTQAQEWARLIFPYLLGLAGVALGFRWLGS